MAIPWSQVESKPEFQSLSPEDKIAAQEQYFNQVVAPQAGDQVDTARTQFFSQYDYSEATPEQSNQEQPDQRYYAIPEVGILEENIPPEGSGRKDLSDFSAGQNVLGAIETGLSTLTGGTTGMISGAAGGLIGAIGDLAGILTPEEAQDLQQRAAALGTYEPRTEAGQAQVREIGELTQALPPIMGPNVPQARIGRTPKARVLPEQAVRAERFAQRTGSPLLATDIDQPTTYAGKALRSTAEKVPIAGTGGLRSKQAEARVQAVKDFTGGYDAVTDQDLYNSLVRSQSKRAEVMSGKYDAIGNQMGDAPVPPTKTIAKIDSEIDRLSKPGKVRDTETINKLQELKSDLEAGTLDYQGMRENRTLVREKLRSETNKTSSDRVIDNVYKAMTDDIHDAVLSKAGPEAVKSLKQVDAQLAKQYSEAKKTKLKNVLNKGDVKPEEISKMLLSNDKSESVKLYKELDGKGRESARGFLVGELAKAFEDTESPEKFLQRAKKLENQFDVFFKGDQKNAFQDLTAYLNQTREAARAGVENQNGQQILSMILPAIPIADITTTGGAATAGAATVGVMGRLMESRKVRSALRSIRNMRPYTPEYNQALIALDNAVQEVDGE